MTTFDTSDTLDNTTICAVSTPPGRGGIAVIRVSGPDAVTIVDALHQGRRLADAPDHSARFIVLRDEDDGVLDQAVATVFRGPHSFTGEDTVEISVHGSTYIQQRLLDRLTAAGAVLAGPGQFTRRAFTNGRLDLAEAEAVADMIASSSRAAHRLAAAQLSGSFSRHIDSLREQLINLASLLELELDFSEEDVTFADRAKLRSLADDIDTYLHSLMATFRSGQAIREGIPIAIVGRPNVGKSSLLNALLQSDRAIVSDIPGTTRDTVEETIDIDGTLYRFIDTAGIRATDDPVESLGIGRALDKAASAHVVLWLLEPADITAPGFDPSLPFDAGEAPAILVINKSDLAAADIENRLPEQIKNLAADIITVSAKRGDNIETLKRLIAHHAIGDLPDDSGMIVTNQRHYEAIKEASEELASLLEGLDTGLTPDLLALHLRAAIDALSSITGAITSTTILNTIFSRFCIGK